MKVTRIPVHRHALLVGMSDYLASVAEPAGAYVPSVGNVRADIDGGPPGRDRPQPASYHRLFLPHPQRLPGMRAGIRISALHYYPAGGGLGWHTDSGAWGWRVYVVRHLEPGYGRFFNAKGAFYVDDPSYANAFYVRDKDPFSWHAVHTSGPRLSLGVRIKSKEIAHWLGLEVEG